jgi:hypothetical protein
MRVLGFYSAAIVKMMATEETVLYKGMIIYAEIDWQR